MGIHFGAKAPSLDSDAFHGDPSQRFLEIGLMGMCNQVNGAYSAVALFEFSSVSAHYLRRHNQYNASDLYGSWLHIAARDFVMRIADFEVAWLGAKSALGGFAKSSVNDVTPSTGALLDKYFPKRRKIRNSAAHATLPGKNQKQWSDHSASGAYDDGAISIEVGMDYLISEFLDGDRYKTTWDGQVIDCAINQTSLNQLEEAKAAFLATIPESLLRR